MKSKAIVVPSIEVPNFGPPPPSLQTTITPLHQALNVPSRFRDDVTPEEIRAAIITSCRHSQEQLAKFGFPH